MQGLTGETTGVIPSAWEGSTGLEAGNAEIWVTLPAHCDKIVRGAEYNLVAERESGLV